VLYFTSRFKSPLCMHHLKIDQEIEPPDLPSPNPSDSDNRLPLSTCPSMTTNRASCVIDIKCEVQAPTKGPPTAALSSGVTCAQFYFTPHIHLLYCAYPWCCLKTFVESL